MMIVLWLNSIRCLSLPPVIPYNCVTVDKNGQYIDNYTRHFVPFPISTFALCSVHRTSVIKRPTIDYCVILKNVRCTEHNANVEIGNGTKWPLLCAMAVRVWEAASGCWERFCGMLDSCCAALGSGS